MKRGFLLFILIITAVNARGQNSYYETDTSFTSGIKIIRGKNYSDFQKCLVYSNGKYIEYSPYQVKQYGLDDGTEYFAREIEVSGTLRKVFLERLIEGKTTLFYYGDRQNRLFFIEKENSMLYQVPYNKATTDQNLPAFLKEISVDCPVLQEAAGVVKYNRVHLAGFIGSYNDCRPFTIQKIRYGIMLGLGAKKLVPSQNMSDRILTYFDYRYESSLSAGVFVNIPVLPGNYSVQIEMLYSQTSFSYSASTSEIKFDFDGDIYFMKMPAMLRYTHPSGRLRPFVNGGIVLGYNIKKDLTLYQESLDNTPVIPVSDYNAYIKKILPGLSAGGGVEYKLSGDNSIFFEMRYDYLSNGTSGSFLNSSEVSLTTGINF